MKGETAKQNTKKILLIRPENFGFNVETAESNAFSETSYIDPKEISTQAKKEFDRAVEVIRSYNINVEVIQDTASPIKPDAVFSNNWVSYHSDGKVILYPMLAQNRQLEVRRDILEKLSKKYYISEVLDLSAYSKKNTFLESTGSIIFDHIHNIAYACLSERTDTNLFKQVCNFLNYKPITFTSVDKSGKAIYHTNVMMCIGEKVAIICLESIIKDEERKLVKDLLEQTDHEIIDISLAQVTQFAGNMIELVSNNGEKLITMSRSAYLSLTAEQLKIIKVHCTPLVVDIPTIEKIGGGSVRCTITELFLPTLNKSS